eukprot:21314_1
MYSSHEKIMASSKSGRGRSRLSTIPENHDPESMQRTPTMSKRKRACVSYLQSPDFDLDVLSDSDLREIDLSEHTLSESSASMMSPATMLMSRAQSRTSERASKTECHSSTQKSRKKSSYLALSAAEVTIVINKEHPDSRHETNSSQHTSGNPNALRTGVSENQKTNELSIEKKSTRKQSRKLLSKHYLDLSKKSDEQNFSNRVAELVGNATCSVVNKSKTANRSRSTSISRVSSENASNTAVRGTQGKSSHVRKRKLRNSSQRVNQFRNPRNNSSEVTNNNRNTVRLSRDSASHSRDTASGSRDTASHDSHSRDTASHSRDTVSHISNSRYTASDSRDTASDSRDTASHSRDTTSIAGSAVSARPKKRKRVQSTRALKAAVKKAEEEEWQKRAAAELLEAQKFFDFIDKTELPVELASSSMSEEDSE